MAFRAVDERDAVPACERARYDGDYSRLRSSEGRWKERKERKETEDGGCLHDSNDVVLETASSSVRSICES